MRKTLEKCTTEEVWIFKYIMRHRLQTLEEKKRADAIKYSDFFLGGGRFRQKINSTALFLPYKLQASLI